MSRLITLSLLILAGCLSSPENITTFQVKTTPSTNEGIPFYAIVKSTELPQFLSDDYQKIATQTMLASPDPANLKTLCFIPGTTQTFQVQNPENKSLALYFIFTNPGEEWKYLVHEEQTQKVKILLGQNEIKSISKF